MASFRLGIKGSFLTLDQAKLKTVIRYCTHKGLDVANITIFGVKVWDINKLIRNKSTMYPNT